MHDLDSRSQKCIDTKKAHISFNSAWIVMKFGTLVDALNTFNSNSDRFLKIQNGRFYGATHFGAKCQFLKHNRYHYYSSKSPHFDSEGFQNSFQICCYYDGCRVSAAILDFSTISYQNLLLFAKLHYTPSVIYRGWKLLQQVTISEIRLKKQIL